MLTFFGTPGIFWGLPGAIGAVGAIALLENYDAANCALEATRVMRLTKVCSCSLAQSLATWQVPAAS